jgi:predicted enzyme related to lactoylglutathione lyase
MANAPTATATITRIRSVGIYVTDQDRARQFWTETIGFELIQDTPMGPDAGADRWLEVKPPGDDTLAILYTPPGRQDRIGGFSNILFHCADINATYRDLAAKGVEFTTPPKQEMWGWWAQFKDPDGNEFGLGQD